tara:strand:+ start:627 stop:734 length:108 start_codon:yes stop_codon:yes gene_type:complete
MTLGAAEVLRGRPGRGEETETMDGTLAETYSIGLG